MGLGASVNSSYYCCGYNYFDYYHKSYKRWYYDYHLSFLPGVGLTLNPKRLTLKILSIFSWNNVCCHMFLLAQRFPNSAVTRNGVPTLAVKRLG